MSNPVLLDNITHKDIKIRLEREASMGDNIGYSVIVPQEFRQIIACYPILFRKNAHGKFEAIAIFGFSDRENLFLNKNRWQADYLPLSVRRAPFMIGYSYNAEQGVRQPVIHIDMKSPRISYDSGVAVFLTHGGISPYLQDVNHILGELLRGITENNHFTDALVRTGLLEPFVLRASLHSGDSIESKGFYTISEEKLRTLSDADVLDFHNKNYFELIYEAIASLSNVKGLIKRKEALTKNYDLNPSAVN